VANLFTQAEIPYFNALLAGQYDASTVFDASTPLSHVAYSLNVINDYHRQNTQDSQGEDYPQLPPGSKGVDEGMDPNKKTTSCDYLDVPCYVGEILGSDVVKDVGKRIGLLVLALVLLVIAILSFR